MRRISAIALTLSTVAVFIFGCSSDSSLFNSWNPAVDGSQLAFSIGVENDDDNIIVETRTSSISFDKFEFHIVREGEEVAQSKIFKKFDFTTNKLYIDGVEDGLYTIYILAATGDIAADGAVINSVSNINDSWLEFKNDELKPLTALYYISNISIEVANGSLTVSLPEIKLNHYLGRTTFKPQYNSETAELSTVSLLIKSDDTTVASTLSLGGKSGNPKRVSECKIKNGELSIMLPPSVDEEDVAWTITHNSSVSFADDDSTQYTIKKSIESAISKSVVVNLAHKYDDYGVRYFRHAAAANYGQGDMKFTKILTKDEVPADYVYDGSNPRYIYLNKLHTTTPDAQRPSINRMSLFNMQSVGQVEVYAKIDGSSDKYQIIKFDSLPPLVELDDIDLATGTKIFSTQDGRWHRIEVKEDSVLSDVEVVWAGKDSFSKFINEITVPWWIAFHNNASWYAAFENGEYARECLCQMFNIAWIFSQESYWTYLETVLTLNQPSNRSSIVWGDSTEEIDFDFYKTTMTENYAGFRIGKVPDGRGVAGYGSHYQFSVLDDFWTNAFGWASYKFYTIIHEMGHGWTYNSSASHVCNLVTGNSSSVATQCANYFSSNMSKMPFPTFASVSALRNTHTTKN